jgi:hypothetical protein
MRRNYGSSGGGGREGLLANGGSKRGAETRPRTLGRACCHFLRHPSADGAEGVVVVAATWQRFKDPALERQYMAFFVTGRRFVLSCVSCVVLCFSSVLTILLIENWGNSPWLGGVPSANNPAGLDLTVYFGAKAAAHVAMLVVYATALITVNVRATQLRWDVVSYALSLFLVVVNMAVTLTSTSVGYREYVRLYDWALEHITNSSSYAERLFALNNVTLFSLEVTNTQSSNSMTLLLLPSIFSMVFGAPILACVRRVVTSRLVFFVLRFPAARFSFRAPANSFCSFVIALLRGWVDGP